MTAKKELETKIRKKNICIAEQIKTIDEYRAELKEAEKAIEQNESAIRMLAKQRDEMDAKLKEAGEDRDKAITHGIQLTIGIDWIVREEHPVRHSNSYQYFKKWLDKTTKQDKEVEK